MIPGYAIPPDVDLVWRVLLQFPASATGDWAEMCASAVVVLHEQLNRGLGTAEASKRVHDLCKNTRT